MFGFKQGDQKLIVQAHYSDGVRVFDITDDPTPKTVAYLDTEPDIPSLADTTGNWGVHIFPNSKIIVASSTIQGLFIMSYTPPTAEAPPSPPPFQINDTSVTCGGIKSLFQDVTGSGENSCCSSDDATERSDIGGACQSLNVGDLNVLGTLTVAGQATIGGGSEVDEDLPTLSQLSHGRRDYGSWYTPITRLSGNTKTVTARLENRDGKYSKSAARISLTMPERNGHTDQFVESHIQTHYENLAKSGFGLPAGREPICNLELTLPFLYDVASGIATPSNTCMDRSWHMGTRADGSGSLYLRASDRKVEVIYQFGSLPLVINTIDIVESPPTASDIDANIAFWDSENKELSVEIKDFYLSAPGVPRAVNRLWNVDANETRYDALGLNYNITQKARFSAKFAPVKLSDSRLVRVNTLHPDHWVQIGDLTISEFTTDVPGLTTYERTQLFESGYGNVLENYFAFGRVWAPFTSHPFDNDKMFSGWLLDRRDEALPIHVMVPRPGGEVNAYATLGSMNAYFSHKRDSDTRTSTIEANGVGNPYCHSMTSPEWLSVDINTNGFRGAEAAFVAAHELVHMMQYNNWGNSFRRSMAGYPSLLDTKKRNEKTVSELAGVGLGSIEGMAVYLEFTPRSIQTTLQRTLEREV